MQKTVDPGAVDVSVDILILDSSTGLPEQAVTSSTSGLALWYRRDSTAKVAISPSNLSLLTDAHSDGGLLHVDDGYYRLDIPDAAFVSGVESVLIGGAATGMVAVAAKIQIVDAVEDDVWGASPRTLTSFGTLAADVWASSSRTLTGYGTLIADIWVYATRTLSSFGTLETDIWASPTRTLTSFGTLVASIWSYARRRLTQFSLSRTPDTEKIEILRGDTAIIDLILGDLTGYVSIDFVVKSSKTDADTAAIIWIRKNATGEDDGLLKLNGADATEANGSITIIDLVVGSVTVTLEAVEAAKLVAAANLYDAQTIFASSVTTPVSGIAKITEDIAKTIT